MPQFEDIHTFSSQIFWLIICFAVLYVAASRIYLPRIKNILEKRDKEISGETHIAEEIRHNAEKIDNTTKNLRETSAKQYNITIDQCVHQAHLEREEGLKKLKDSIIKMIEHSKAEIASFQKKSETQSKDAINQLADKVNNKFFNI